MGRKHLFVAGLGFLVATTAVSAQDASFRLIGSVSQKAAAAATSWDGQPTLAWALTSDLAPQFRYGPVSFDAVTTWTIPESASLTSADPTVAVAEAYFRITPVDGFDLTIGQKRYNIGVGQTFTVGDSINPVIGFFDQKTGFRGATAEWSPVTWASASAAVSTENNTLTGAGQVSLLVDLLQMTASLVTQKDTTFNPALGLSYDWGGIILSAEGAAEFLPQGLQPGSGTWTKPTAWSSPSLSGSAGARYTFSFDSFGTDTDLTLSAEYLHWGQGWTASQVDSWKLASGVAATKATAASALSLTKGVRDQENAFFKVTFAWGTTVTVVAFAAVDLQDSSVLTKESFVWTPWDNLDLTAALVAATGDTGTGWAAIDSSGTRYQASLTTTYHF